MYKIDIFIFVVLNIFIWPKLFGGCIYLVYRLTALNRVGFFFFFYKERT